MPIETVKIEFVRYRTPDGLPTCALDFNAGYVCPFIATIGMCGKSEVCLYTNRHLFRSEDGKGYLQPADSCPIWSVNELQPVV
jgi:hypothetical protein